MEIQLEHARRAIDSSIKKAEAMGLKMNIAVVDRGANLVSFARMDGAWLGSVDIAVRKAKTSRFFDMETGELGKAVQPGQPLFNIGFSNGGLITFPGGFPIKDKNGEVIGAIGVSGSTVENDRMVAIAGKEELEK